ncbi:perilipin-1-like isoform X3 [Ascaphus truei]|uniref:perilipin-1-like isoform X3 n=1 Tax=Ascaphus truei TaxID=8439 RepID=UPI003F590530
MKRACARPVSVPFAVANSAALRVVAELEKRLPVLDQPADEVASDLRDGLVGRVRAWRDQAVGGVQGVLGRAQAAVKETRKAVSLSAITLASLGFGQTVSRGAELAISQAEELVNRYLPEEEEAGGYESCGSDGSEEAGGAEPGLFSRARSLVITVVRRSLGRLHPYLDGAWGLLNGGILLLRSLPDELWRRFQRVRRALLLEDVTKEVPKPSATPMKIKIGSLSRSVRTHSLSKRRLYLETKTSSYNHRMPTFLVSGSGNRILPEQGDESVRIRYNRRQSLDSFF